MKILINGFGRIGRAVARMLISRKLSSRLYINDIAGNPKLLMYLLENDSLYGKFEHRIDTRKKRAYQTDLIFSFEKSLDNMVKETSSPFDFIVDSTPKISHNYSGFLKDGRVRKVLITQAYPQADFTYVYGVNEAHYNKNSHNIVSMSVCDAMAIAPVLKFINDRYQIESGSIITLHPWLSYQNLLDNPTLGYKKSPDFSLYRSAIGNLIPRSTSAINACSQVIPELKEKINGFNIRVPTATVTSANLSLILKKAPSKKELIGNLCRFSKNNSFISTNEKHLVSSDFSKTTFSCIIDLRFLEILPHNLLQLMLWYDNEWGYASKIVDFIAEHRE